MFNVGYTAARPLEKDIERDAWFVDRVSPVCGRMLHPYRMLLDQAQVEDVAVRMANSALTEFRRFGRRDEPTVWAFVMSSMRRTMNESFVDAGVLTLSLIRNAKIVSDAVDRLAVSGTVSLARLIDCLPGLGRREIGYLHRLAIEIDVLELLVDLKRFYRGSDRYTDLASDLSLFSEKTMVFLSLVVQGGMNCEGAGQSMVLSEFEIHFMIKAVRRELVRLNLDREKEHGITIGSKLCKN